MDLTTTTPETAAADVRAIAAKLAELFGQPAKPTCGLAPTAQTDMQATRLLIVAATLGDTDPLLLAMASAVSYSMRYDPENEAMALEDLREAIDTRLEQIETEVAA